MGTDGTIEITVGDDIASPAIAWWYREPPKADHRVSRGAKKEGRSSPARPWSPGGANGRSRS